MHTGLTDPHSISVNKASGRTQYAGGYVAGMRRVKRIRTLAHAACTHTVRPHWPRLTRSFRYPSHTECQLPRLSHRHHARCEHVRAPSSTSPRRPPADSRPSNPPFLPPTPSQAPL